MRSSRQADPLTKEALFSWDQQFTVATSVASTVSPASSRPASPISSYQESVSSSSSTRRAYEECKIFAIQDADEAMQGVATPGSQSILRFKETWHVRYSDRAVVSVWTKQPRPSVGSIRKLYNQKMRKRGLAAIPLLKDCIVDVSPGGLVKVNCSDDGVIAQVVLQPHFISFDPIHSVPVEKSFGLQETTPPQMLPSTRQPLQDTNWDTERCLTLRRLIQYGACFPGGYQSRDESIVDGMAVFGLGLHELVPLLPHPSSSKEFLLSILSDPMPSNESKLGAMHALGLTLWRDAMACMEPLQWFCDADSAVTPPCASPFAPDPTYCSQDIFDAKKNRSSYQALRDAVVRYSDDADKWKPCTYLVQHAFDVVCLKVNSSDRVLAVPGSDNDRIVVFMKPGHDEYNDWINNGTMSLLGKTYQEYKSQNGSKSLKMLQWIMHVHSSGSGAMFKFPDEASSSTAAVSSQVEPEQSSSVDEVECKRLADQLGDDFM